MNLDEHVFRSRTSTSQVIGRFKPNIDLAVAVMLRDLMMKVYLLRAFQSSRIGVVDRRNILSAQCELHWGTTNRQIGPNP